MLAFLNADEKVGEHLADVTRLSKELVDVRDELSNSNAVIRVMTTKLTTQTHSHKEQLASLNEQLRKCTAERDEAMKLITSLQQPNSTINKHE